MSLYLWLINGAFVSVQAGDTALTLAAKHGHKELVRLLLEAGADVNSIDNVSVDDMLLLILITSLYQ